MFARGGGLHFLSVPGWDRLRGLWPPFLAVVSVLKGEFLRGGNDPSVQSGIWKASRAAVRCFLFPFFIFIFGGLLESSGGIRGYATGTDYSYRK